MIRRYIDSRRLSLLAGVLITALVSYLVTQSSIQEAETQPRETEDTPSFSTPNEEEDFASDRILVKPKQGVSEEAVERYEASPDIEYAEPDFILKPSQTTTSANDPSYSKLYGLNNTGQTGGT